MKKTLLLLLFASCIYSTSSSQIKASKNAAASESSEYNTTVNYNANMSEVKGKSEYYLLINLQSNGLPAGQAKLVKTKDNATVWEGEYFLFNRMEPGKSRYNGLCTWYYPNKQKKRESNFKDGTLEGKTTLYNEAGKITYSGMYKGDNLQGDLMTQYDEDGNVAGRAYVQLFDVIYSGWEGSDKDGESVVEKGELRVISKLKDGYAKREIIPIDASKDFTIETEFKLKAPEVLVMYGQKDANNYYGVNISGKGILKLENAVGGVQKGSGQQFKVSLNRDGNVLKLMKMGDNVFVSLNGNMVTSYKYSKFYGENFGFYIPVKGEVAVQYVVAKENARIGK